MGDQTDAVGGAGASASIWCVITTSNIRHVPTTATASTIGVSIRTISASVVIAGTVVGVGRVVVRLNMNSSIRVAALDIIGGPTTTKHVPETAGLHGRRCRRRLSSRSVVVIRRSNRWNGNSLPSRWYYG